MPVHIARSFMMRRSAVVTFLSSDPRHSETSARRIRDGGGDAAGIVVTADAIDNLSRSVQQRGGCDVLIHCGRGPHAATYDFDKTLKTILAVNASCTPLLSESKTGSMVTISPPVRLARVVSSDAARCVATYGTTLAALAEATVDLRSNCVWPRHVGRSPSTLALAVYRLAMHNDRNAACLYDDEVIPLPRSRRALSPFSEEDTRQLARDVTTVVSRKHVAFPQHPASCHWALNAPTCVTR